MPSKRDREPEETIALEENSSQSFDDDDALLKEFQSSSSEGENSSDDEAAEPIQSLMTPQDTAKALDKALKKKPLVSIKSDPGVIYLGRIPHGFYEEEMESYFSQFGQVCRLRLSRNKKTGKSKHYAFIEFASRQVAEIVAETMDNYLILNHQLKCKLLKPEQVHPALFKGANKTFKVVPWHQKEQQKRAQKSKEQFHKNLKSLVQKEQQKRQKLQDLGISYSFKGIQSEALEILAKNQ